jgi:hypothetical protein
MNEKEIIKKHYAKMVKKRFAKMTKKEMSEMGAKMSNARWEKYRKLQKKTKGSVSPK